MKLQMTDENCRQMRQHLTSEQSEILEKTLLQGFSGFTLLATSEETSPEDYKQNTQLVNLFVAAKKIEGCSNNTIKYYANTLTIMAESMKKSICTMATMETKKGMPIEQVQKLLGHSKIDTTMQLSTSPM